MSSQVCLCVSKSWKGQCIDEFYIDGDNFEPPEVILSSLWF